MTDHEKLHTLAACFRQAVLIHAPKEEHRDPRWTRFINQYQAQLVKLLGPLPPPS